MDVLGSFSRKKSLTWIVSNIIELWWALNWVTVVTSCDPYDVSGKYLLPSIWEFLKINFETWHFIFFEPRVFFEGPWTALRPCLRFLTARPPENFKGRGRECGVLVKGEIRWKRDVPEIKDCVLQLPGLGTGFKATTKMKPPMKSDCSFASQHHSRELLGRFEQGSAATPVPLTEDWSSALVEKVVLFDPACSFRRDTRGSLREEGDTPPCQPGQPSQPWRSVGWQMSQPDRPHVHQHHS